MPKDLRVAIVGLDTSHAVEFPRRMQAPDCPSDERVEGLRAATCMRFETPFQNQDGLNDRQQQLEAWGVKVTEDFQEAVSDVDAVLIEVNDPALHVEYFTKCLALNKPLFLDKPLADTVENGRKICALARKNNTRVFSCSSLRFVPELQQACDAVTEPIFGSMYGPLGVAAAGSSIVWYGVHAFEMLERAMGTGATQVTTREDKNGVVCLVDYADGRRGIVELTIGGYVYGGCLRTLKDAKPFVADHSRLYTELLLRIRDFLRGGPAPVSLDESQHIMAMLDAAERSRTSGEPEMV